jgi:uncharacterized membrane protein YgcG
MNAFSISDLKVKVFIPTFGIGFCRFHHHHLFIPGFQKVWSKIIRLYEAIVHAWYSEISTCSSGIVLYQTVFSHRLPNAERFKFLHGFRLYSPAGKLIVSYIYPKVRYIAIKDDELVEDDNIDTRKIERTQYYIYGNESAIGRQITWDPFSSNHIIIGKGQLLGTKDNIFGCNGEIIKKRNYDPEYIVQGWLKRSGNIYDMITSGVLMEIVSGYKYVMYGLTSDPNQVFGTVWARILQNLSNQLKLYYTDWGGNMFLGVWDRLCGLDLNDTVVDWTNDSRRYPFTRYQPDQPYLADISISTLNTINAPTISLCSGGGSGSSGNGGGGNGSSSSSGSGGGGGGSGSGGSESSERSSGKGKEGGWNIWLICIVLAGLGLWFLQKKKK